MTEIMMKKFTFILTVTTMLWSAFSQVAFASPTNIGERITINSVVLDEQRQLQVLLPEGYHSNSIAHYPVIYLLDGDYNFHGVSGMLDLMSNKGQLIPDVILVGISDKGTDRYRQYMTPEGLTAPEGLTNKAVEDKGKASVFINFLAQDVKPYMQSHYRVADNAMLVGHSMGGLFVLNALLKSPETFEHYVSSSPSVWLNIHAFIKQAKDILGKNTKHPKKHKSVSLYLSLGDETRMGQYGFIHLLDDNQPDNIDWKFSHYPDENHNSVGIISLRNSLKHLYKDWYINERALSGMTPDSIIANYKQLLTRFKMNQAMPTANIQGVIRSYYRQNKQADIPALMSKIKNELPASEQAFTLMYASYVGHYDSAKAALKVLKAFESRFASSVEYIKSIAVKYEQLSQPKMAFGYYEKAMKLAKQQHANQWQINIIEAKLLATKG
jgi:predicted alpha/beta superfamily hydrolase